jgi:hypothetical protein
MVVLPTWLPAVLAAVACGVMTFPSVAVISAWGTHVYAGTREPWLPPRPVPSPAGVSLCEQPTNQASVPTFGSTSA